MSYTKSYKKGGENCLVSISNLEFAKYLQSIISHTVIHIPIKYVQ